jgi:tetratricopeptide (TPR) repeat protein
MAVESSRDSVNVRVNPNEAIAVTPELRAPMSAIAPINPEAMQTRDDSDVPAPHVTPSEDDVEQDDYLNRLIQPEEQSEDFADDVESDPLPISQPLKWKVLGGMSDEPTDTDDDVELDVGDADIGDKSVGDDAIENEIISDRAPAADAIPHAQDQPAPDEPSAEWITHLQNQTLKYAASQDYEVEPAPLTLSDLQTMPERAEPIAQTPDLAPVTQDEFGVAQKALNAQDYAAVYDALERLVRARKKKTEVIEIIERVLDDSDITLPIMDRAKWYRLLGDAYTRNKQDDRAMRAYQTGLRIAKRSNLNTKK